MQEIWLLQTRFSTRQKRRVMRLLAHPRFRAAYDFLVLRLAASTEHAADVEFWREAQTQSGEELAATLGVAQPPDSYTAEEGAPPSKRRRRRRRRSGTASPAE
jgi:poly(A) polymerase